MPHLPPPQVWRFIVDREIEAPERFQAIQSYRATMAVLRQQADFVGELFASGVVDELERDHLLRCVPRACLCPAADNQPPLCVKIVWLAQAACGD